MIVYVWSRRNPDVLMNLLGVFNFTAPLMPWVLLGFSLLLTGSLPTADIMGIVVGHLYYYLKDMYPRLYGRDPLCTPAFLAALLNPPEAAGERGAEMPGEERNPIHRADRDGDGRDAPLMPQAGPSSSGAYQRIRRTLASGSESESFADSLSLATDDDDDSAS